MFGSESGFQIRNAATLYASILRGIVLAALIGAAEGVSTLKLLGGDLDGFSCHRCRNDATGG